MKPHDLITIINQIPLGFVCSYGQIAEQMDKRFGVVTSGWMVGRMMNTMGKRGDKDIHACPWRRVVNKQGYISLLKLGEPWLIQINHLKWEWVIIVNGEINMKRYWFRFS